MFKFIKFWFSFSFCSSFSKDIIFYNEHNCNKVHVFREFRIQCSCITFLVKNQSLSSFSKPPFVPLCHQDTLTFVISSKTSCFCNQLPPWGLFSSHYHPPFQTALYSYDSFFLYLLTIFIHHPKIISFSSCLCLSILYFIVLKPLSFLFWNQHLPILFDNSHLSYAHHYHSFD